MFLPNLNSTHRYNLEGVNKTGASTPRFDIASTGNQRSILGEGS